MRAMTPEDYLMQVKNIDLRIRTLQGELHDAENAEELRKHIKADIEKHKEVKFRIRDEVQQIGDHRLSTLLTEYYIRGKSWEQVAEALNVKSVKNTRENLRAAALKAFAAQFQKYFI